MKRRNATRNALLMSVLSMLLCVSMLVGTTFAWFTDSVTSANNIIKSGTLDVEMMWADGTEDPAAAAWKDASKGAIFNYDLWEPGYTEVRHIKIANVGNLALKYQVQIVANGEVSELADVIDVYYVDPAVQVANRTDLTDANKIGTLTEVLNGMATTANGNLLAEEEVTLTIALKMQETAGNEYQNMSIGSDFSIVLLATQYTHEEDSFDDQYDAGAEFAADAFATDPASLKDAIANADEGDVIVLVKDVTVNEKLDIPNDTNIVLDLNGCTLAGAFDNQGGSALIDNKGTLTIENGTVVALAEYPDVDWGTEGFPTYATNTISNKGNLVIGAGAVIENKTNQGGASYAVDNYAGATLTVNAGAKIIAKDCAIRMFSGSATSENKVVINGGDITGKRAVWIQLPSSNAAVAPLTTLEVNGGNLNSTSDLTIYSYSYGNSFANTKVTINGGTFAKDVAFGAGYYGDKENVTVTGGTFNGKLGRYLANDGWEDIAKP